MLKRMNLILPVILVFPVLVFSTTTRAAVRPVAAGGFSHSWIYPGAAATNDREQDGLAGPVRRVRTETAKLITKDGKPSESAHVVLETATYDIKGNKTDNAYFLAAGGTLTGKEVYKYDDKGNITEMTLQNSDGSLLSKEIYTYEFDGLGNWTKMTTSVAVLEGGKVAYEPTEVTYRIIAYYLEDATAAKLSQPPSAMPTSGSSVAQPASSQPAATRSAAAPSSSPASTSSVPASNAAGQLKDATGTKALAVVSPAVAPTSAAKPLKTSTPPDLAADKSRMYAVSHPAANGSAGAGGGSSESAAPVVRDAGDAPSRPMPKAPVRPVSGGVLNGKAVSLPSPIYSSAARSARAEGTVSVEVVIDATGKVISAHALSGPALLHQSAEKAAMQARFSPTLLSGQPVKVSGVINYKFALN